MTKHTPGPWKWIGEDYRGDWGWQILVGPKGEGIIVGQDKDGGPCKFLKANLPLDANLCITGLSAEGEERAESVHVFSEANARLIAAAPELLEFLKDSEERLTAISEVSGEDSDKVPFIIKMREIIAKVEGK